MISEYSLSSKLVKRQLAQRILGLGEMARKRETEREKVQPFANFAEESKAMEAEINAAGEVDPASVTDEPHPLALFHVKFNKVMFTKYASPNVSHLKRSCSAFFHRYDFVRPLQRN